jgi:3-hydroxyisobutyrate dehydrogenase
MSKIAFIGLGHMGSPMALNLVRAGHDLVVFDLALASVKTLVNAGARAADSASQAVRGADIVITMLPASKHVEGLYLGDGLIDEIDPSALVIDCSTIAPETARRVAASAYARGVTMIDAPVSGGTAVAAAGTLTFIVGGEAAALERVRPILKNGEKYFPCGRRRSRSGRQNLQQHALGHSDDRHL